MAERSFLEKTKNNTFRTINAMAELMGFRARPVPLDILIEMASKYNDKYVVTEGFYEGVGDKRFLSRTFSTGDSAWIGPTSATHFYVSEQGKLSPSLDCETYLRVYRVDCYASHENKAKEVATHSTSDIVRRVRMKGYLNRGAPGEYYLHAVETDVMEELPES